MAIYLGHEDRRPKSALVAACMSAETLILEASKLSTADRIRIAEAPWQSAWDEQAELPITAEQRTELERRLADYDANRDEGDDWTVVRNRLEKKL